MNSRSKSQEVYDIAVLWAAKVDAGPLTAAEQASLGAWLDSDVRNLGAFAQASALLEPIAIQPETCPVAPIQPPNRRRLMMGGSIAACVAIMAGATTYTVGLKTEHRHRTQVGEMLLVPLSDGSSVSLNTNSEIVVRYTKDSRDIELVRGEALFDVAHNKQRPFIVHAGNTQVRAVGTSFTVRVLPDQPVQILVREGVVEIKRHNVPVAPTVRVAVNTRAIAPVDSPIVAQRVETAEVDRELAWRVGHIALHGETLGQAAAEFGRYSDIKIQIDDPTIANERITGLFASSDPVGFAKAVALSFDLHADVNDKEIRLKRKI